MDAAHADASTQLDAFVPLDGPLSRFGFIQGASNITPNNAPSETITLAMTAAQVAGDLDVVAVSWTDENVQVDAVTDTDGNTFKVAGAPIVFHTVGVLEVFVALDTKAGASPDKITVTFQDAVVSVGVAAEYAGLATTNAIDVSQAATGISDQADSGTKATTNAHDLVLGIVAGGVSVGPGTGYTARVTDSINLDLIEDRVDTAKTTERATAPLSNNSVWLIDLLALKAAP